MLKVTFEGKSKMVSSFRWNDVTSRKA